MGVKEAGSGGTWVLGPITCHPASPLHPHLLPSPPEATGLVWGTKGGPKISHSPQVSSLPFYPAKPALSTYCVQGAVLGTEDAEMSRTLVLTFSGCSVHLEKWRQLEGRAIYVHPSGFRHARSMLPQAEGTSVPPHHFCTCPCFRITKAKQSTI